MAIERSAREAAERQLLDVLKERVGEVDGLLELFESVEKDGVYRYYHQSLKVYSLQGAIRRAQRLFDELAPTGTELNVWLVVICQDACAHQFDLAAAIAIGRRRHVRSSRPSGTAGASSASWLATAASSMSRLG